VRDFRFSKNPTREKNRALVVYHKELLLVGNATRWAAVCVWLFCDVLRPECQNFTEVSEKSGS